MSRLPIISWFASLSVTLATIVLAAQPSRAMDMPMPTADLSYAKAPFSFNTGYNFEGIVALNNCSGSLIAFETSKPNDMAMILTNGHCFEGGFIKAGAFLSGVQSARRFTLYDAQIHRVATLQATQVLYASMTTTDITLYRLGLTYAQIFTQYGIHPLTLSSKHPAVGTPMNVVSGYWERGYSCNIAAFIPTLKESSWSWQDSIKYSQPGCETIGGTSGSPVIQAGTETMIGINNTGNENGQRCTENNPCEVDAQGNISYAKGTSYGQQTYIIYSCLNANNEVDLSKQGCMLFH